MHRSSWFGAAAVVLGVASPAVAAGQQPSANIGQVKLTPILDFRARYEGVNQETADADAVTLRVRGGFEAKLGQVSLLAEGEATVAPLDKYNAFPFPLPGNAQWRPRYAVVADPENIELNRLQLQYSSTGRTATLGRQRIDLDDQRWVGSVGWRQNEQTLDAIRGEAQLGEFAVDLSYAVAQRSVFGEFARPRTRLDGDFILAGVDTARGAVRGKLFAYLLDYDEAFFLANSSQTYGGFVAASIPISRTSKLALRASYARQSDFGRNPFDYSAEYWSIDSGTTIAGFALAGGWERLGADNGRAVQTPMATLHKFNGWADMFLTTPAAGLEDAYVSIGRKFDRVKPLPGLNANLAFHQFDSAVGDVEYGTEWDASAGFTIGKVAVLLKYANYDARSFGTDTRKLWLQAQWAF